MEVSILSSNISFWFASYLYKVNTEERHSEQESTVETKKIPQYSIPASFFKKKKFAITNEQ